MPDWVIAVVLWSCILFACWYVPRVARRLDESQHIEHDGWLHPHVDRDWSEPRKRARQRESEQEEDR